MARPHHHMGSAELFYVISGSVQLLTGERLVVAGEGNLAVVPSGLIHAFAAAGGDQLVDGSLIVKSLPGSAECPQDSAELSGAAGVLDRLGDIGRLVAGGRLELGA